MELIMAYIGVALGVLVALFLLINAVVYLRNAIGGQGLGMAVGIGKSGLLGFIGFMTCLLSSVFLLMYIAWSFRFFFH